MTWTCTNTAKGDNKLYSDAKGVVPSLDLRFAEGKTLNDYMTGQNLITFSRSSIGTYIDENGIIQTATADTPRFDHDPTTGESLGLLIEESRTNSLLNSATLSTQSVTTFATAYTLSFYGTGTVTLSGTSTAGPLVGTGADDRVTLTFTPTTGTLTLTVTGTVSNAQLEAGVFPTSYIPTTGTALTRSEDVASITGSNFSSWYNQSEGTLYQDCTTRLSATARGVDVGVGTVLFGSGNSRAGFLHLANSTTLRAQVYTGTVYSANLFLLGAWTQNVPSKAALAYKQDSFAASANGATPLTDTSGTVPILNALDIGRMSTGTFNRIGAGTFARITYFPERLPDSSLQTMTTP